MPKLAKYGEWSNNKRAVAEAMAEGIETQGQIAKRFHIQDSTISRWKHDLDFLKKIDEITLTLERHTLAGMLRRIDDKQEQTDIGKNEWLKVEEFRAKLLGFDKQKVEHTGEIQLNTVQIYIPDNGRNDAED